MSGYQFVFDRCAGADFKFLLSLHMIISGTSIRFSNTKTRGAVGFKCDDNSNKDNHIWSQSQVHAHACLSQFLPGKQRSVVRNINSLGGPISHRYT